MMRWNVVWRCVAAMICVPVPSSALLASPIYQLAAPLPENVSISGYRVSPNWQWVVYETKVNGAVPNSFSSYDARIYSVPIGGGTVHQLNHPQFANNYLSLSGPIFSSTGNEVFFKGVRDTPDVSNIYRSSIDGSSLRIVTSDVSSAGTWSDPFYLLPDDSRILYQPKWASDLHSSPVGPGSSVVLNESLQSYPASQDSPDAVSPIIGIAADSVRVVYQRYSPKHSPPYNSKLYSVRSDGTEQILLAENGARLSLLSPDGQTVVFSKVRRVENPYQPFQREFLDQFSIPIEGGQAVMLHPPLPEWASAHAFSVSPDGRYCLMQANIDQPDRYDLYSVPTAGGDLVRLTPPVREYDDLEIEMITSDGRYFVYSLFTEADDSGGLFKVALDGSDRFRIGPPLKPGTFVNNLVLSADERRVIYTIENAGATIGIYTSLLDGPETRQIPVSLPHGLEVSDLHLTENGNYVVFVADSSTPDRSDVYYAPLAGGPAVQISPDSPFEGWVRPILTVTDNWAVFMFGPVGRARHLYALQLPEPSIAVLLVIALAPFTVGRYRKRNTPSPNYTAATRCRGC